MNTEKTTLMWFPLQYREEFASPLKQFP